MKDTELKLGHWTSKSAFTLIEMMVVLALIVLIATSVLPSAIGLFTAGAEAQAYNVLSAQLSAARALAITEGTYAGVHVQRADPDATGLNNAFFLAVMIARDVDVAGTWEKQFVLADGFDPRRLPGSMTFGEVSGTHYDINGDYVDISDPAEVDAFTTFTIVFSPTGAVVRHVNLQDIQFDNTHDIFSGTTSGRALWDPDMANENPSGGSDGEPGATAVVLFDYAKFRELSGDAARDDFLKASGRLIAVNIYTGQLFAER